MFLPGGCSLSSWYFPSVHPAGRWMGPDFLHQLDTIFYLYQYYRLAPGFCTACCAGLQWVGALLVSVRHWLILSLTNVALSGCGSPWYWANISPIVYVVLAVESWNYCSGVEAQHLPLNVCLTWLHWMKRRGSGIPGATLWHGIP